jgi:hypothetical protein
VGCSPKTDSSLAGVVDHEYRVAISVAASNPNRSPVGVPEIFRGFWVVPTSIGKCQLLEPAWAEIDVNTDLVGSQDRHSVGRYVAVGINKHGAANRLADESRLVHLIH